jgi:hypothetical protein
MKTRKNKKAEKMSPTPIYLRGKCTFLRQTEAEAGIYIKWNESLGTQLPTNTCHIYTVSVHAQYPLDRRSHHLFPSHFFVPPDHLPAGPPPHPTPTTLLLSFASSYRSFPPSRPVKGKAIHPSPPLPSPIHVRYVCFPHLPGIPLCFCQYSIATIRTN